MKPQDIVVLLKLHLWTQGRWKIASLASSIFLSPSETHGAIKRLERSSLFDAVLERPKKSEMEEFLIYGLRYCFPATLGTSTRGIPTAHSAEPMKSKIISSENDVYVWPDADGEMRGLSIEPIYKTAPKAAQIDQQLYEYLILIDCLRIGKKREISIAKEELVKKIRGHV